MLNNRKSSGKSFLWITSLIILLLPGIQLQGFSQKQAKEKRFAEGLTLMQPIVLSVDRASDQGFTDENLNSTNRSLINDIAIHLLSSKHKIIESGVELNFTQQFYELLSALEAGLPPLQSYIDTVLNDFKQKASGRYILIFICQSSYNSHFPPHAKLEADMFKSSILLTPGINTKAESDGRVVIFDTLEGKVLLYNSLINSRFDPRVEYDVTKLTRTLLKKVYYL